MDSEVLAALPLPLAHAAVEGQPITLSGHHVGSIGMGKQKVTPDSGSQAVQRWLDLYDRATWLMSEPDPCDPRPQRTASQAIDSLFRYEHQMTPFARRQARETLWQRDRSCESLVEHPLHAADEVPPPECHCSLCRSQWERCRCSSCRLARMLARSSSTEAST